MNISLDFVDTNDSEMREDTTPVVVALEAPPRPPHLAVYQDLTDSDPGGGRYIDGRHFSHLEHHRGQTMWVWRISGGQGRGERLVGEWALARIETYREQAMRLEGCLDAERGISKALETLIERAADVADLTERRRCPSQREARRALEAMRDFVHATNRGMRLWTTLGQALEARASKKRVRP